MLRPWFSSPDARTSRSFSSREADEATLRGEVAERPTVVAAQTAYDAAVRENGSAVDRARLHAMLEFVRTKDFGAKPANLDVPCYFNSGCCSYGDGDVTGLEISGGSIRLVRWLNNDGEPQLQPLSDPESLDGIFEQVRSIADQVV